MLLYLGNLDINYIICRIVEFFINIVFKKNLKEIINIFVNIKKKSI
jgi:hypothetical protein